MKTYIHSIIHWHESRYVINPVLTIFVGDEVFLCIVETATSVTLLWVSNTERASERETERESEEEEGRVTKIKSHLGIN